MPDEALHPRSEVILSRLDAVERDAVLNNPAASSALVALAAFSPALTQALAARVDLARWLFLEGAFNTAAHRPDFPTELAALISGASTLEGLQAALRYFRLKEMARLAVRDLAGLADLDEVMGTLSALAETALDCALDSAVRFTAGRHRLSPEALPLSPVILGMGKLGARELNYSSDVDLIYLYRPLEPSADGPTAAEAAAEVFTFVTRAMSEVTEDGFVFRVDLDLRPGGKDGAQAQSIETALKHYLALGRPWERLALLKARPVAGDREAGLVFLSELTPFILRRHLDYTSLEEIRDLKERFSRENVARTRRGGAPGRGPAINVKLSPGGIREIEFFAQALTITFGGRLPHLRQPATLGALGALADEGIITTEDRDELTAAYRFLRTVEHRLQLRELTQTQTLPRGEDGLSGLSRSLGFDRQPAADFLAGLETHMNRVKKRFRSLLAEPDAGHAEPAGRPAPPPEWVAEVLDNLNDDEACAHVLERAGFRRPKSALAALRNIRMERFLPGRLARYGRHLERLLPQMLAGASGTPDPDRAVLHLERFLESIGPRAGFFVLLEENPQLIGLLSTLFGSSDHFSGILINHPALLDSFIDRRSARVVKDKASMAEELDTMLGREEDPENLLTVIRRFKNDETLRVGLYDLLGQLTWEQIEAQLSDLAETVMERTLKLAAGLVLPDWTRAGRPIPLAVMGLGKLGGRELSYGSDLDLVFILDDASEPGLDMVEAVRLSQRFISYLSVYLDAGPGYEIDSRLRPSGGQGPLVVTPHSFERYHESSRLWERQALLKLRQILGSPALGDRVTALADAAIFQRELPEDAAGEIDDLKRRMRRERGRIKPGTINLKFSPGGLVDAEFLAQYLQLRHGRGAEGPIRSANTRAAMGGLSDKGLGPGRLADAGRAYEFLGRAASRLGLIHDRAGDRAAYTEEEIAQANLPDADPDPVGAVRRAMDVIRDVYAGVFGREA